MSASLEYQTSYQTDAPDCRDLGRFLLMCLGMFMAILDIQVVRRVAAHPERASHVPGCDELDSDLPTDRGSHRDPLDWALTRVFTLRWLFAGAVGLLTVASIGCALSGSFAVLLAFRAVQGFSGGVLIRRSFRRSSCCFRHDSMPAATTIGGVVAVLAPTSGPSSVASSRKPGRALAVSDNVIPGLIAARPRRACCPVTTPTLPNLQNSMRACYPCCVALATSRSVEAGRATAAGCRR